MVTGDLKRQRVLEGTTLSGHHSHALAPQRGGGDLSTIDLWHARLARELTLTVRLMNTGLLADAR